MLQQVKSEEDRLNGLFNEVEFIRNQPTEAAKRKGLAQLGSSEFNAGRDGSDFIEALNASTIDQLNFNIDKLSMKAGNLAGQFKQVRENNAPPKAQTAIAQAREDFKNNLITKEDLDLLTQAKKSDITSIQKNLIAAGLKPGTPEFQQELLASIRKPVGTTVNVGDPSIKGKIEKLTLKIKELDVKSKTKKLNEFTMEQNKAAQFASMMVEAEKNIESASATGFDPTTAEEAILTATPGGNIARSEVSQLYRQAQEAWVRAKLRKESGAVIAVEEMEQEIKTFFPQLGDKAPVVEQKRKSRLNAQRALRSAAAGAFDAIQQPIDTGFTEEQIRAMTPDQRKELRDNLLNQ